MIRLIGLRWIGWRKRILDHVSQHVVKHLRHAEVHSEAAGDLREPLVVRIDHSGCERQVDAPVDVSRLSENVDMMNRRAGVSNFPPVGPDSDLASAPYNNFIVSHNHPLLVGLNARSAGGRSESSGVAA